MISEFKGQTLSLASSLNPEDFDGILAVGGDGTLFEVINGLLQSGRDLQIPLGQIPVGTGNSFIKDLGISDENDALKAVLSGNVRNVDLGEFSYSGGSRYFVNLLGTGFVSNVAYRARKYKMLGSLSYILAVLEELVVLKAVDIELVIDGEIIKRKAVFTEICNSRYTGGDMLMAPAAEIDDGMLDVIVLNKVSRRKILSLFPLLFKGEHVNDDAVELFRGRNISLKSGIPLMLTPDGETFGDTPFEVKMHPGKIRMFC
jgi:YegS/Rv2252/BmrU family lipid kinase